MRPFVMQSQARQLLHNKFVVVLGGSVQRSMYKDLVLLLQRDQYLTLPQLKSKGEFSFEQDVLVEGGQLGPMTNGTEYREVRQYRSDHHLLRFYFLTRIYSPYMESILEDFRQGLKPDVLIISSCLWDITRYGLERLGPYKENLHKFFGQIKSIVYRDCLIVWALAMPLGKKITGGFLVPEVSHLAPTLRYDIIEANFYGGRVAEAYGVDVLDLHFHFRFSLQHRMPDGVHWDALAHRRISCLLLWHAADAWGVDLYTPPFPAGRVLQGYREDFDHHRFRPERPCPRPLRSVPLQRCDLVQHQQSNRSDSLQLFPPTSDGAANTRPLLLPTQPANQPAQTAGHRYRAEHPAMELPLCRQQDAAAVGRFHSGPPVQPRPLPGPRVPADGDWRLADNNPLPTANRLRQQVYVRVGATCSQRDFSADEGFRFRPHFQADDPWTRRRRGTNFRTHPYPPHLHRGTNFRTHPYPPHLHRGTNFRTHTYPPHLHRGTNFRTYPYPPHLHRGTNFRTYPYPPHLHRGTNFRTHPYPPHLHRGTNFRTHPYPPHLHPGTNF